MSLAWIVGIITAAAYTAYLMTNILPLIFPQCPYRTLLCDLDHAHLQLHFALPRSLLLAHTFLRFAFAGFFQI